MASGKGPPGIVDVAAKAGVSIATVSRAFSRPEVVREPTRKRIEAAASELGYIRDRMAGSMGNRFTGTVGLIVPTIDNAIFAEMIEAFAQELRTHDRAMLIAAHGYDLALEEDIIRSLLERRIDGIALVGLKHKESALDVLKKRDVPVISIWNYQDTPSLPCIGADNHQAAALVTRHLVDLGHRDIALMFPDTVSNDRAFDRKAAALKELTTAGVNIPAHRDLVCPYDIRQSKSISLKMLENGPPQAVVCGNDVIAHGVMFACYALGLKVPQDISIVGIGDFRGSAEFEPGLTTVRLPAKRIGRMAASAIITMSEQQTKPVTYAREIEVSLVKRGSTMARDRSKA